MTIGEVQWHPSPRSSRRWTTAPRPRAAGPRSAGSRRTTRRFGLFIGGEWREPARGRVPSRRSIPATGKPLARVAQATAADVDARGAAPPARRSPAGGRSAGTGAPATSTPSRGRSRSTRRLFAVLEIARQRQADPRVARHRHPAGRPPLLPPRRLGAAHGAASCPTRCRWAWSGRSSPGTSRCSCWRGRSRRRSRWGTRWCSSRPSSPRSPRSASPRSAARSGLPPGVVNIITGDGRTGEALVDAPRRRQDRLHRLDRGRPHHPQGHGRQRQEALAGAGRQVALHRLRRRRPRQRGRGRGGRHLVQPGPGLLRGLAHPGAGGHRASGSSTSCAARMETLRVGDPLDKAVDIGAIVAPVQLEQIQRLVQQGRGGGRDALAAVVELPAGGLVLSRRRCSPTSRRPPPSRRWRSSARWWCS